MKCDIKHWNLGAKAWLAFGSLVAVGLTMLAIQEFPSLRREWRLMRM